VLQQVLVEVTEASDDALPCAPAIGVRQRTSRGLDGVEQV
jgi:hypothetical protein